MLSINRRGTPGWLQPHDLQGVAHRGDEVARSSGQHRQEWFGFFRRRLPATTTLALVTSPRRGRILPAVFRSRVVNVLAFVGNHNFLTSRERA